MSNLDPSISDDVWFGILKEAFDAAFDGILITDANLDVPGPRILHANPAFCRMTGYSAEEVIGREPRFLQGAETDRSVMERLRNDLENGRHFEGSAINYRKDGTAFHMHWTISPVRNKDGQTTHFVAVQRDVTESKRLLEMLQHQAVVDGLTGAVNRAESEVLLNREIKRSHRYGTPLTVLLLDLDHFKQVNDTWGHNAGDAVLKTVVELIKPRLRSTDFLGRWGGEEFVVALPQTSLEGGMSLAEDLRQRIRSCEFEGGLRITCSFGLARYEEGQDQEALIEAADKALYKAKEEGRDRVVSASG